MNTAVYSEPYKLPASILAVAVHGAFFALLYFGFTWQTLSPATMSVELWRSLPDIIDAPPVQPKIEEVAPPPQPEKIVEPEVVPPQPEKIVEPEIILPDKKAETKPIKVKPDKKKPAPIPEKKVKPKPTRQEMEARTAEQAARERAEQAARERAEQAARELAEQAERVARERIEQAARERAEQSAATGRMVDEYTGKIVSKIRRNIVMPPDVADDARAEFLVTLLPGGTVLGARLTKSSGHAAYDNAVERAILKSQPLPLPTDVAMFSRFRELELVFKPIE